VTVTLNPLYRFDTFVVGSANRLAVTAAKEPRLLDAPSRKKLLRGLEISIESQTRV